MALLCNKNKKVQENPIKARFTFVYGGFDGFFGILTTHRLGVCENGMSESFQMNRNTKSFNKPYLIHNLKFKYNKYEYIS